MTIDHASAAAPALEDYAEAALQANTDQAKGANLAQVAELKKFASDAHVAEHLRAMVAVSLAHLPVNASDTARENATQWQTWTSGVADGLERS